MDQNQVFQLVRLELIKAGSAQKFVPINFDTAVAPEIRSVITQEFQKEGQCEWATANCFIIRR